jgi:hypothetical protein
MLRSGPPMPTAHVSRRLLRLSRRLLTRLHVMPDPAADIARGKESGRRWARDQAQRSEIDQLRYMYKQQAPSEAGEQMSFTGTGASRSPMKSAPPLRRSGRRSGAATGGNAAIDSGGRGSWRARSRSAESGTERRRQAASLG